MSAILSPASSAHVLRELSEIQRRALEDYARALGVSPNDWHLVPATREFVEQLAVANVVARITCNPARREHSITAIWNRAAALLGLSPRTARKRRERARSYLAVKDASADHQILDLRA
jgi:hypothetical protein